MVNHRIIAEPPSPPPFFSRQNHRHRLSPARPAARHYRGIAIAAGILARDYLLSLSRLCARARHRLSHASKLSHAPTPLQRPRLAPNVALSAPALFRDSAHDLPAPKGAALPHTDSRVSSDRLRDAVEQQRPPPANTLRPDALLGSSPPIAASFVSSFNPCNYAHATSCLVGYTNARFCLEVCTRRTMQ